ncbi:MAG: allophanate hydrolase subunit 1 [Pseudomonadota bacterium]
MTFSPALSEPANRAALAFRAAIDNACWEGVEETATSLVSTYIRFDLSQQDHQSVRKLLVDLLSERAWLKADFPKGRRLWRIPTVYGGEAGPQLEEAARAAGLSVTDAIDSLSSTRVRVQTIGFAPGMPYLGELPQQWDLPRLTELTKKAPAGALCVAIRQLVMFPAATPTGWRQVGRTALQLFRPETEQPFVLRPGDEVQFVSISADALESAKREPDGGAVAEPLS